MLVCHCNVISDGEIEAVILELLREDRWQMIVPGKVFRALAKRGKCAGCVPNMVDIIVKVTENYHLQKAATSAELIDVRAWLEAQRRKLEGDRNERRTAGHRAA